MIAGFLVAAALAGDVQIEKKGLPGAFVHVDGAAVGKVTKKENFLLTLADGPHELWFSRDKAGLWTACHGIVQVGAAPVAVTVQDVECGGLSAGTPPASWSRGAALKILDQGAEAWITVDGSQPFTLLNFGMEGNLAPGAHILVVTDTIGTDKRVMCQGTVTLDAGEVSLFAITPGGCTGFDNEVHITVDHR